MRRQMLRYGPDLIAVDTTHDLTRYPGILVGTLMTIGAAGEGQPVAFFLVPAESELELSPVFHALKSRYVSAFVLGGLSYCFIPICLFSRFPGFKTRFFMSDCAHAFWNTWSKFFDVSETNRQFCLWHVWKNWTKHLAAIKSAPDRRRARAALLILARYGNSVNDFIRLYLQLAYERVIQRELCAAR